ncbi:LysE family translocator [Antarcticirhabdus aurantiaca]|uniref:LysE family translocator n=1 Tax=Antarcticirhabdus aurantiaca TaxID=2606717 RepID=A0ACD4NLU6_9HYPH|nr:LysE family translocator [Antarcticirhabdus aurantiaca]WAJ27754.1 LysE family translocator [Jeongeuplla avenae]
MSFLPDAATLAAFTLAALVLTVTPGPDMTLYLGRTFAAGPRAGLAAYAGASTGSLVHTALAALGLSALLAASPTAFLMLKVAGAAYLLWLAIQAIRHGSALPAGDAAGIRRERPPLLREWAKGLSINLLNPKIVLFFVAFLPSFVSVNDPHAAGKLFFLGLYFVVFAAPLNVAFILLADRLSLALRRRPAIVRAIDWLFAGVFSVFAAKILLARA